MRRLTGTQVGVFRQAARDGGKRLDLKREMSIGYPDMAARNRVAEKGYDEMNKAGLGNEKGWLGCIIQDLHMMSRSICILSNE